VGKGRPAARTPRLQRPAPGLRDRVVEKLLEPVDIASIVVFRIAFGAILAWEVFRYFKNGWIGAYWIQPDFYFTYFGFGWLSPLPGDGMYFLWAVLGVAAVCMLVGLAYRVSATVFFLGFAYEFLLDKSTYLNHFYLVALLSFLMIFVPANRAFALDALRKPSLRSSTVPAWSLWALRLQIGLVYFFGGVAKLSSDWLHGEPMHQWLEAAIDPALVTDNVAYLFSYGGLALDFLAFPLLLWRKTRPFMFVALVGFHVTNSQIFQIGIFPWFMLGASTLFFDPDWPRRLFRTVRNWFYPQRAGTPAALDATAEPAQANGAARGNGRSNGRKATARGFLGLRPLQQAGIATLALFFAIQFLMPLRHLAVPGNVNWTEEGHRFSWRMKLRDKDPYPARFFVTDPQTGRTTEADANDYLDPRQIQEMSEHPDMLLQFSHYLAGKLRKPGGARPEVRVIAPVSLNGRIPVLLVDRNVNLAAQKRVAFGHSDWIRPLREPLHPALANPPPGPRTFRDAG
jgi:hypothetical protein